MEIAEHVIGLSKKKHACPNQCTKTTKKQNTKKTNMAATAAISDFLIFLVFNINGGVAGLLNVMLKIALSFHNPSE